MGGGSSPGEGVLGRVVGGREHSGQKFLSHIFQPEGVITIIFVGRIIVIMMITIITMTIPLCDSTKKLA